MKQIETHKNRNISQKTKKTIAARQRYKCANKPGMKINRLENYNCPLWQQIDNQGTFDEIGYDIDHIIEYSITNDNSCDNLQALCKKCHCIKTKNFMDIMKIINEKEYDDNGMSYEIVFELSSNLIVNNANCLKGNNSENISVDNNYNEKDRRLLRND